VRARPYSAFPGPRRPAATARADCAFPTAPTTYEGLKDRQLFLNTIELAANNLLFPGDPYFGVPEIQVGPRNSRYKEPGKVPPILLKSIAWIESSVTQGGVDLPFGSIGPALISFDCGHGVTQVTTGMTIPTGENGRGSPEQALVATHFAYNIARGAAILVDKWNEAPEKRPIAGIDTNGHPGILENWYFAVWGYNGFTGPGSNQSNHPLDPIYGAWPRPAYSCGPTGDGKGHNRARYPYQELVLGCAANPPVVEGRPSGRRAATVLAQPNDQAWRDPLKLANFVFPYTAMDIPTPQPFHLDATPKPRHPCATRSCSPRLAVSKSEVKLALRLERLYGRGRNIDNTGTGVLAWYATPSEPWLIVKPYCRRGRG
jgi:hypothetical protein